MNRVLLFFVSSALFLVAIWAIEGQIPDRDPFDAAGKPQRFSLDGFAESEISKLKLRHAYRRGKPYDLGLFGNSRILSVGHQNLNLGNCSVYNFALSGQSLRSSAVIIEELAKHGVLPKVSIISIDHFELQKFNNPVWLKTLARWRHGIGDVGLAFSAKAITLRYRLKILWRVLWTETLAFQQQFEFKFFRRGLLQVLNLNSPDFPTVKAGGIGYREDGSIQNISVTKTFPPLNIQRPQIINALLRNDLERIANVMQRTKRKAIFYESPLHPVSAKKFQDVPSHHASLNRKILLDTCASQNLECRRASINRFSNAKGWSDYSHPPPMQLGKWINDIVATKLGRCRP